MKTKNHIRVTIVAIIALAFLLALDQLTKYLAVNGLKGKGPVT